MSTPDQIYVLTSRINVLEQDLASASRDLSAAQRRNDRLDYELDAAHRRVAAATERAELAERALKLEVAETARLERAVAAPGHSADPPPGLGTTLPPAADADRRNLLALQDRVRELEAENDDLRHQNDEWLKLVAG